MMKVLVKKFKLKHDGKLYGAGSVVELSEKEATVLVASAPAEFEIMEVERPSAKRATRKKVVSVEDEVEGLPECDTKAMVQ